jgi:hypothetical protein
MLPPTNKVVVLLQAEGLLRSRPYLTSSRKDIKKIGFSRGHFWRPMSREK